MWTDTDLCWKGGAGGLLLETSNGPSFLPLPTPVLEQVAQNNNEPGVTTLKLPDNFNHNRAGDLPIKDVDLEVCFVCKKCRMAYPSDGPLLAHQRQCYGTNQEERGAFRIVQTGFECRLCNKQEKFKNFVELKTHFEQNHGQNAQNNFQTNLFNPQNLDPKPLTHEIEEAVNQITLIAAKTNQTNQDHNPNQANQAQIDSNSNSTFCQPPEPKKHRLFLSPADVPQSVASVQH